MRHLSLVLALTSFIGAAPALKADAIPYPNIGTPISSLTLAASSTGNITGYFVGSNAFDTSLIQMIDVTSGTSSVNFFNNHSTVEGSIQNFGSVTAGDVLVFRLIDLTKGIVVSTRASDNPDGFTHGYAVGFSGGMLGSTIFPSGIYLGMEDTRFPRPVFAGDTLRAETKILAVRESKSRPTQGIVTFEHRGFNQHNEEIAYCRRIGLMMRRPA